MLLQSLSLSNMYLWGDIGQWITGMEARFTKQDKASRKLKDTTSSIFDGFDKCYT